MKHDGAGLRILLSQAAYERFGGAVRSAVPGAQFLVATDSGACDEQLRPVGADVTPDIAWFSSDLFAGGAGTSSFAGLAAAAPGLKWLHSSTAGLDSPFFGKLRDRGVRVTGSHIYGIPVSEFVIREALDFLQEADRWRAAQASAAWEPHEFRELAQTTWTVIGLGSIGQSVCRLAAAFGANVNGVSRHEPPASPEFSWRAPHQLWSLLPGSDVVVLARAAAIDEPAVVDATFLAQMRSDALFVNVARGSLVDEVALIEALDAGGIGRAVLDVMQTEPLPFGSPLWTHPRVVVTPHSGGQGLGRYERGARVFIEELEKYASGS